VKCIISFHVTQIGKSDPASEIHRTQVTRRKIPQPKKYNSNNILHPKRNIAGSEKSNASNAAIC